MYDDDADFVIGLFIAFIALVLLIGGGAIGYWIGQDSPSAFGKFTAVCESRGGQVNDNVCTLGDKVIMRYHHG